MRIYTTILFIAIFGFAKAQDQIVRTNGDTIKGYISIVQDDEIKYRKTDDRSAPVFTIKKSLVKQVVYENGEVDDFAKKAGDEEDEYNYRNRVSFVYTDVFIARMMFAYEHIFPNGYIGLRVPVAAGFSLPD